MTSYQVGRVGGLAITARPSVFVASFLLWAGLSGIAVFVLGFPLPTALGAGLAATALHWVSTLVHALGHAWAARRTGYPMSTIQLRNLVGLTVYPKDEPPLPAEVHIQRALGGPLANMALAVIAGCLALAFRNSGGVAWWLALYWVAENALVYLLQAVIPLGFNDGATLYHWWGKRGSRHA